MSTCGAVTRGSSRLIFHSPTPLNQTPLLKSNTIHDLIFSYSIKAAIMLSPADYHLLYLLLRYNITYSTDDYKPLIYCCNVAAYVSRDVTHVTVISCLPVHERQLTDPCITDI